MALASYTDLVAAVTTWFPRTDLVGTIPTFVALCEARLNRNLRCRQMEATSSPVSTNGVSPLPADFLQARLVTWLGNPNVPLEYATPDYVQGAYVGGVDLPNVYTIIGSNLIVAPIDDTGVLINYWQKIPGLQAAGTNWLMTAHPDVYLCGTLVEAFAIERKTDAATAWDARLQAALAEIMLLDNQTRQNGPMRIMAPTP